jgi:hypothetical protein
VEPGLAVAGDHDGQGLSGVREVVAESRQVRKSAAEARLRLRPGSQLVIDTEQLAGLLRAGRSEYFLVASNLWGIPEFFVHGASQGGDFVAAAFGGGRGDGAV